jgi:hypothetical protein
VRCMNCARDTATPASILGSAAFIGHGDNSRPRTGPLIVGSGCDGGRVALDGDQATTRGAGDNHEAAGTQRPVSALSTGSVRILDPTDGRREALGKDTTPYARSSLFDGASQPGNRDVPARASALTRARDADILIVYI